LPVAGVGSDLATRTEEYKKLVKASKQLNEASLIRKSQMTNKDPAKLPKKESKSAPPKRHSIIMPTEEEMIPVSSLKKPSLAVKE
jgi:hypothetical protein